MEKTNSPLNDPSKLAQAFKQKASELRDIVYDHLPANLKAGLMVLEAMSPDVMTQMFNLHVAIHGDKIKERDAAFFLSDDVCTDPTLVTLRGCWPKLPEAKKDVIWAILKMLCNISRRYAKLTESAP